MMRSLCALLASIVAAAALAAAPPAETYDLVLVGGRVLDPETGLDAVRNVGIRDGRIVRLSETPLHGREERDARHLVVAPGFIDLHQHAQDEASSRLKAFDGVTTALEMEIGAPDVAAFLARKQGHSLIHFGTTASHPAARARAFGTPFTDPFLVPPSGPATNDPATAAQLEAIDARLRAELDAGALGIGMGIQYTPGATRHEVIRIFRLAAERHLPVFTHVRSFGRLEPGSSIEAVSEVIGAAAITGAPLQIVHVNSSCTADAPECLRMIAGARARGLDVTTEAYPYVAGMTTINSALFNPGWRERLGVDYDALMLPDTNERLTRERFEQLHASPEAIPVILFTNPPELVDRVIEDPLVSIASDGEDGHPRNAGTFTHVLAHNVRERGALSLMDAVRKMTLMPARRLEASTAAARRKGRVQEGADADLVVFDPATVGDRSTFAKPREPSVGMHYVIVGGALLIDRGQWMTGRYPGAALRGDGRTAH